MKRNTIHHHQSNLWVSVKECREHSNLPGKATREGHHDVTDPVPKTVNWLRNPTVPEPLYTPSLASSFAQHVRSLGTEGMIDAYAGDS